ncbi:MAG TPA: hypothetical protein VME41_08505 [Stellaceae bacterium]|nr:hypothetical protein [Stellaceae bacterium]
MLSHEWRELEVLCQRISDLRHRYAAALKTNNAGLVEGLRADLARAKRMREQVVHHISARLSWAAAEPPHPGNGSMHRPVSGPPRPDGPDLGG